VREERDDPLYCVKDKAAAIPEDLRERHRLAGGLSSTRGTVRRSYRYL